MPSSISLARATIPLTVYALRKDGFSDEITLALKDAPQGFSLGGGRVAANQDQVRITLTAPPTPIEEPVALSLEGRAQIDGQQILRPAVPAGLRICWPLIWARPSRDRDTGSSVGVCGRSG